MPIKIYNTYLALFYCTFYLHEKLYLPQDRYHRYNQARRVVLLC